MHHGSIFLGDIRETTVEMAQESIDYFIQMAKYYAKAEKDLEVQKWVFVNFERKDGHSYVRLFSYDLPREVFERRKWVIDWRKARLVCQYPKDDVRYTLHFYDKRLGLDIRLNEDLRRLISAKAQVTKVQRKIDKYVAYNKAHNLFFDESTDTDLLKAREKLEAKIANVKEAEERMKLKIKQIQEGRNGKN
ncbi:hypothetical protein CE91St1_07580 [Parabacteroides goldsteinii]|jgi:hypothetical protein|uniref:Uncharacterized protein n=2 Tax=Bacteroidales TaxID=171549 RepID=A0AA37NZC1_9BACT|nr:hypothetical protein M120_4678 [Bacteroides fragilis str. 3783N1-8]GKG71615.1 hypothetical protein CE91St1_07580 [Parabacteroides goldsteinii]GKG77550.1 hypothetical protein CE91St2_07420 [Parabacteroides goldsteinii]GKH72979.1 hypothetical protein CE91St3_28420 [Parabacteroides merdae]